MRTPFWTPLYAVYCKRAFLSNLYDFEYDGVFRQYAEDV